MELDKIYNPSEFEDEIYKEWEEKGLFKPEVNPDGKPWTISMPPPNATGTLHLGHASMIAIEDLMIRYHRLKGDKTLWVPGTDHAAIATQSKVEGIIKEEEGKSRHDLGREEFLNRVKAYVAESQDTIRNQIRKMGASVDWERERYTFEDSLNRMVNEVFVKMYNDGLIYRGNRIINWDPIGQTTVSDDEINHKEEKAKFYTFKYGPFEIGTARPETKFGDKYVVMHPEDKRYKDYKHGDTLELEWINGPITATVIKDEAADPEFGTGVMTITPWHSVIDFEIAERHNLDKEQIIDLQGNLLPVAQEFAGMSIQEARDKIVEKLDKKGLLVSIDEDYVHNKAESDRFKGVIEPQIMKQWFVDVNKEVVEWKGKKVSLKKMLQNMVNESDVQIIPKRFEKTYFAWIDNLRDWCISRQIWWGHQVPVWYKGEEIQVGVQAPEEKGWEQDPDTLDTWFSSSLWTWSTLVDKEKALDFSLSLKDLLSEKHSPDMQYHPTQVLETGYDIIFFWVARMMLMTGYVVGEVPFEVTYLHGLVRDAQGRKMSKSLGNGIDPLDVAKKFGADAVRLSLVIGGSPGNDMRLSEDKISGYRNFVNKLWNIARFILMSVEEPWLVEKAPKPKSISDRWILSRFEHLVETTRQDIEAYKFSFAGENLYEFTWSELADWYVEDAKVEGNKDEILLYILQGILKLWHPYMPFATEVLWKNLSADHPLITAKWPQANGELFDSEAENEYARYIAIVGAIRNIRAEFNIPYSKPMQAYVEGGNQAMAELVKSKCKLDLLEEGKNTSDKKSIILLPFKGVTVHLIVEGLIDFAKESERLNKELEQTDKYMSSLEKKLSNKEFVKNAPKEVVAEEKDKLEQAQKKIAIIKEQIKVLS